MINIALVGNPNVGKTSLFNRITHSLEHVGNWHGVTVEKKEKAIIYENNQIKMADLPGLYSLTVYSPEEAISRDCILAGENDLVACICEVNNLARNLYLAMQLLEADVPVVLVINMMDELKKQGKFLNVRKLESFLKIPIVPMSAKYHSDVHLLMDICLERVKDGQQNPRNKAKLSYLDQLPLEEVYEIIGKNIKKSGLKKRYAAIKALENDKHVLTKLDLDTEQLRELKNLGDWQAQIAALRYGFIDEITFGAVYKRVSEKPHENIIEGESGTAEAGGEISGTGEIKKPYMAGISKIDKIVLNKYLALPVFFLIMAGVFILTFGLIGGFLSDLLGKGIENFIYSPLTGWLTKINTPEWVTSLVGDGIINGVGGILVFLPQILLLFLFLAFLEDSGYISRVAFMTDGLFRKIGLSGRSVFTMLMGFGCSATAILTARGLEDDMMRKKTVLLTPFMSCSARLPVYTAIAGAFFRFSPLIIFALYIIGALTAILFAAVMQKIKRFKSGKLSFIMEMPPYRVPTFERVFQLIWHNIKVFLVRVGTVVFALNVIVWALSSFSFKAGFLSNGQGGSIMQLIAGFIAPVFKPLGFGEWKAVTALLSGLIAKEVVISSLQSFGGAAAVLGESGLAAFCFLVFTLLYVPCVATLAAIKKEIGFKWAAFSFIFQISLAYIAALITRGIGLFYINFTPAAITVTVILLVVPIVAFSIIRMIKNRGKCPNCTSDCPNCIKKNKK